VSDPYKELDRALTRFVGRRCLGFTAGAGTGSVVNLELEPRKPRLRPLANPHLTPEQQAGHAEFAVFVESAWRLDSPEAVICGSTDSNRAGGPMLTGLQALVGQTVESFRLGAPGFDLELRFTNGWRFLIFCDQVDEVDPNDNYTLFCPDDILIVGTRSRLRHEAPAA